MTADAADMSVPVACHRCGYDLRAHPAEGRCPECGASVAESRRVAVVPFRPAWAQSDPRWRRRMVAGVWILVFLPLVDLLEGFGWTSRIAVPALFEIRGHLRTLDDTLLCNLRVFPLVMLCIGLVLLFSKERGRRRHGLDWTRRWGVLCSYVTALLGAAPILFLVALVGTGIGAVFVSMISRIQPPGTRLLVNSCWFYLHYGPQPKAIAGAVLVAFAAAGMLLACVPLAEALRRVGPTYLALSLVVPLALFAGINLLRAAACSVAPTASALNQLQGYANYFSPRDLAGALLIRGGPATLPVNELIDVLVEVIKWVDVLTIAGWLSAAQLVAWRRRK